MNCEALQEIIFEHLDGTLRPEVEQELERHLETCEACRNILARHRQLSDRLSEQMLQATGDLGLNRAAHDCIRAACERPKWPESLAAVWSQLSWRWGLAALLLCGIAWFGTRGFKTGQMPAAHRSGLPVLVSLRVPQVMACYTFRKQDGFVVDTLLYRTNVLNAECRVQNSK